MHPGRIGTSEVIIAIAARGSLLFPLSTSLTVAVQRFRYAALRRGYSTSWSAATREHRQAGVDLREVGRCALRTREQTQFAKLHVIVVVDVLRVAAPCGLVEAVQHPCHPRREVLDLPDAAQ